MTSQRFASPAATMPTPPALWQYLYGIIPTADEVLFEVAGLDPSDEVRAVVEGDLAIVTSGVPRDSLVGLGREAAVRYLSAHQRVLELVLRDYPVLPVKFGTTLPDPDALRALLRQGGPLLRATLAAYAGKQQVEVVALWDLKQVFAEIAAVGPIADLRAQIAARPPAETTAERVALGQLVHAELQARRAQISAQLIARLRDLADDLIVNPTMDDSMVLNVALLLGAAGQGALDARLDALDALFAGRLQIRCVGPLPPYSFATLEVRQIPFDAVDAARQRLGLADAVSAAAIKRAYRQLATQAHPDHNPGAEHAVSEMESLSSAYQLLSALAKAQAPAEGDEGHDWPCRLDRAAVERTLLLAVARQDVAA